MIKNIAVMVMIMPVLVLTLKDSTIFEDGKREEKSVFEYIPEEEGEVIDGFLIFPNEAGNSDLYL